MSRKTRGPRASPPRSADALASAADEAIGRQQWERALDLTRQAMAIAPTSVRLALNEGFVLERLGRFDEALSAHVRALALAPDSGEPYFHLALFLNALGAAKADVEPVIASALEKDPTLFAEIEGDSLLAEILPRSLLERARERALRG